MEHTEECDNSYVFIYELFGIIDNFPLKKANSYIQYIHIFLGSNIKWIKLYVMNEEHSPFKKNIMDPFKHVQMWNIFVQSRQLDAWLDG